MFGRLGNNLLNIWYLLNIDNEDFFALRSGPMSANTNTVPFTSNRSNWLDFKSVCKHIYISRFSKLQLSYRTDHLFEN